MSISRPETSSGSTSRTRRRRSWAAWLPWLSLPLFACGTAPDGPATAGGVDETEVDFAAPSDGKADVSSELRLRVADTTLWADRYLVRRTRPDGTAAFVLEGRTSRNVTDGRGFVFDDVYGEWQARGARSFEVTWTTGESATLLQGTDQFIGLSFKHSAGRPDGLTARAVVRPRLDDFHATGAYLTAELTPVVVGGRTVYRVSGHANRAYRTLEIQIGDYVLAGTDVQKPDATRFTADLLLDHVNLYAGTDRLFTVKLDGKLARSARLRLAIKKLGLTDQDAYEVWPRQTCSTSTKTCLAALPPGTADLSSCGEALPVLACGRVGSASTVTDVEITAALHALDTRLADTGFGIDATALVGGERQPAFLEAIKLTAEEKLQNQLGKVFPSALELNTALQGEVDTVINNAYARPLDLVEPLPPIVGDAGRARNVAADGLLLYMSTFDFEHSLFERSLVDVVLLNKVEHIKSLQFFREQAVAEQYPTINPDWDFYVGRWAGVYVELRVDRNTGAYADTLFEID
jgi:hypothetical protein